MPIYLVVAEPQETAIEAAIETVARLKARFRDYRVIAGTAWMIRTNESGERVSEMLFPRDAGGAAALRHVVARVQGSSGYHQGDLWDWIQSVPHLVAARDFAATATGSLDCNQPGRDA